MVDLHVLNKTLEIQLKPSTVPHNFAQSTVVTHYGRNGVFAQGHVEVAATQEPDLALPLLPNMVDVAVLHKVSEKRKKQKIVIPKAALLTEGTLYGHNGQCAQKHAVVELTHEPDRARTLLLSMVDALVSTRSR